MITIFSCPKPFRDNIDTIQRNAIKSWMLLIPRPEIIIAGNEYGSKEICSEFNIRHIPDISVNEHGTPLVDSIFSSAERAASHEILCYVNADIILMSDFISAVDKVAGIISKFLMIGQRWDLDITEKLNYSEAWENRLLGDIEQRGKLHGHTGIDFFIFSKGIFKTIPSFALGRTIWDNWLIYHIRAQKIPVVDLTSCVRIVHQNHSYSHCKDTNIWKGEEAKKNLLLAGGYGCTFSVFHATHRLKSKGLSCNFSFQRFYYETDRFLRRVLKI